MQFLHTRFLFLLLLVSSTVFTGLSTARVFDGISNEIKVSNIASTITVDQSGHGNFKTIQQAIDSIPDGNQNWIKVRIAQGKYTEQVTIPRGKPYVYLEGQGRDKTLVAFNGNAATDSSATFTSSPDNVLVQGITFQNYYNRPIKISVDYSDLKPAAAARVYGDKSAFVECGFIGVQDTLFDVSGRHLYKNCYIEGAVDFIFGSGQSFFENPMINVTVGTIPQAVIGFITAQGRSSQADTSGFVFNGGSVFGTGKVHLGRAYGPFSRVIFHSTNLPDIIVPQGWDAWRYKGQEKNFIYSEIGCKGPGANTAGRVPWVMKMDLNHVSRRYSKSVFIDQDRWISKLPL